MSDTHATADRATQWNEALTRYLPVNGETLAYRDLGVDGGTPHCAAYSPWCHAG